MSVERWLRRLGNLLVLLLVIAGPLGAQAPRKVVSRLEITGLKLINEGLVRDTMRLRLGEPFDDTALQRDIEALTGLGWFVFARGGEIPFGKRASAVNVRYDAQGHAELLVDLVENPVVDALNLLGAPQALPAEVLAAELPWLKVGRPLNSNPDRLERTLRRLEALYQEKLGKTVTLALPAPGTAPAAFEPKGEDRVVVNLLVSGPGAVTPTIPGTTPPQPPTPDPGKEKPLIPEVRLRVTNVEVRGLQHKRESLVLDTVQVRAGQTFDRDKLQADIDKLYGLGYFYFAADREMLQSIGYPVLGAADRGSRVEPVPDADGKGLSVLFHLVENPVIKQIELVGNELLTTDELLKDLVYLKVGEVLNTHPEKLDRDVDRMSEKYRAKGYVSFIAFGAPNRKILLLTPVEGGVKVTLQVAEARVGKILFEWGQGAKRKTKPRVFEAYMRTKPGQLYNINRIQDDIREAYRLDIVEAFQALPPEPDRDDPGLLNLRFHVEEKRTGNISAGMGVSSRYGVVGFGDVSENNLWGLAQRAALRFEFGGRFSANFNYFLPLLDGAGSELSMRLYNTDDRTGATGMGAFGDRRQDFNQTRRGFSFLYSRPIRTTWRASTGYKIENVSTPRRGSLLPNMPPFPFQDLGSDTTSSVTLGLTHDSRDYPFDATRGSFQSVSAEVAGLGGDNSFVKYRAEARNYVPVLGGKVPAGRREPRPAWVVASRAQLSWSSGRLPFSQSYFIGGSESLRGYHEDRFFGDRAALFNIELRRAFRNNIQAVAFFDAGRAWRTGEPLNFIKDLATGLGIGLRVSTPLGPIRLDLGWGGEGNRTHFSFGQSF